MKFYFLGMLQIWEAGIQNQEQKVACVQTPPPPTPPGKIGGGKGEKAVKCLTNNTMSRAVSVHFGHTETRKHLDYKLRKTFTSKISRSEWLINCDIYCKRSICILITG